MKPMHLHSLDVDPVHEIAIDVSRLLIQLSIAVHEGRATERMFEEVYSMIEALPLPTAEFAVTNRRVANARQYYSDGEAGAAAFELRLAERGLVRRY